MKSFPKSEYWHFKISWKHCQENFQFSRRDFFGLQDFDISTRSYLTSCRDSWRGFGRLDFRISLRSYLILGEFLAAEILRSRRDLGENLEEILRSRRESRRVFGRRDFMISPRSRRESRRDLGNLAGQKLAEILAEISVKILQGDRHLNCMKYISTYNRMSDHPSMLLQGLRVGFIISLFATAWKYSNVST